MDSSNPFSIFETRDDHVSWDEYEEQIDLIDELSAEEKIRAMVGIRYLRVLLGEDFFEE